METQYSEDGRYWWDGEQWQLVGAQSSQETDNQALRDAIEQVGDDGEEPGNKELIEELREYFEPDPENGEDDDPRTEVLASLDDTEFTGEEAS